jgi:hypothetical protein
MNQVTPIEDALRVAENNEIPLSEVVVICSAPLEAQPVFGEFRGLIEIGIRVEHLLATQIDRQGFSIFQLRNALFQIHESFNLLPSRKRAALEKVFKNVLGEHYDFLRRRRSIRISVISPEPLQWKRFREEVADRYPIDEAPDFWKEFPQTIDRSEKRLLLAYEFGRFIAKRLSDPQKSEHPL